MIMLKVISVSIGLGLILVPSAMTETESYVNPTEGNSPKAGAVLYQDATGGGLAQ
jgi:hypothetical protein